MAIYLVTVDLTDEAKGWVLPTDQAALLSTYGWDVFLDAVWLKIISNWWGRDYGEKIKNNVLDMGLDESTASDSLGIKCDLNGSHRIYIRQAYRDLFERLAQHEQAQSMMARPLDGVVITGQPGTGVFARPVHVAALILRRKDNFHLVHGFLLPLKAVQLHFLYLKGDLASGRWKRFQSS